FDRYPVRQVRVLSVPDLAAIFPPSVPLPASPSSLRTRLVRRRTVRRRAVPTSSSLPRSLPAAPPAALVPREYPSLLAFQRPPLPPSPSAAPLLPSVASPIPPHGPNSTRCVWSRSPAPCCRLN